MNFQLVSFGTERLEVTFEPISIRDRNLTRQEWFCFLNLGLFCDSLLIVSFTGNMCVSK